MDRKFDISLPKPRKPGMPPPPPPVFPPTPPKQHIINVSVADNNNSSLNYAVLSSLQVINTRLTFVEQMLGVSGYSQLELGEVSGTAYPGDKGFANALAISSILEQLPSLVTVDTLNDRIQNFVTVGTMTDNLDALRDDIDQRIEALLSGNVNDENVSAIVSSIVSGYFTQEDYTDILNSITELNNGL